MKQIKFRGFRTDGKGWVYGGYTLDAIGNPRITTIDTSKQGLNFHRIHPSSIGMFTGLTDKNGKEIYGAIGDKGGDRISFGRELTYFVKFVNGGFQVFHEMHKEIDDNPLRWGSLYRAVELQWEGYLEIIGNQWMADNGK